MIKRIIKQNIIIFILIGILTAVLIIHTSKNKETDKNAMEKNHTAKVTLSNDNLSDNTASINATSDNIISSNNASDNGISDNDTGDSEGRTPELNYVSYCQQHRLNLKLPSSINSRGVIYYPQNPSAYNMGVDCDIVFGEINTQISESIKVITIPVTLTMQGLYTCDDVDYSSAITPYLELADDYSGYLLPLRSTKGNDTYAYGVTLKSGGVDFDINYTVAVDYERGDYTSIGGGNYQRPIIFHATYTVEVPSNYKGLVLKISPVSSITGLNAASIDSTLHLMDEELTNDTLYFKID